MKNYSTSQHLARAAMLLLVAMLTSIAAWATDVTYTYTYTETTTSDHQAASKITSSSTKEITWRAQSGTLWTANATKSITETDFTINFTPSASITYGFKEEGTFTIATAESDGYYIRKVTINYKTSQGSTSTPVTAINSNTVVVPVAKGAGSTGSVNAPISYEFIVELTDQPYYLVTPAADLKIVNTNGFAHESKTYFHPNTAITIAPTSPVHVITATNGTVSEATIAQDKRSFSFKMPSQAITPSATLEEAHIVAITGDVNITDPLFTDADGNKYYKYDDIITISAKNTNDIIDAIDGFDGIVYDASFAPNYKSVSFFMPTSDLTLTATTSEVHTVSVPDNLTIISKEYKTIGGTKYYKKGKTYTLTVANPNHVIDGITGVEYKIAADKRSATFTVASENITITATTTEVHTVKLPDNLTISPAAHITINQTPYYKTDVEYTLVVVDDDKIINTIAGVEYEPADNHRTATFQMPGNNIELSASFTQLYTITPADKYFTIKTPQNHTVGNSNYYVPGTNISFAYATPDGHTIDYFTYNDETTNGQTFTMPATNTTVAAVTTFHWAAKDYDADGSQSKPYLITTTAGLDLLSKNVNSGKAYPGTYFTIGDNITYTSTNENNFTAIGTLNHPFAGVFDGGGNNGYAISGIRINKSAQCQGLFGCIKGVVQNVNLVESSIIGDTYTGGIVGWSAGTITNCTSNATISASQDNSEAYGGIVGYNRGGNIINCTSNAKISVGANSKIGGIIGWDSSPHETGVTISHCTSSATISSSVSTDYYYGGIAGYIMGITISDNFVINATIPNAQGKGAISGNNSRTSKNNYYCHTKVGDVENATGVGCNSQDISQNNGAVAVHTLALGKGITTSVFTEPTLTNNGIDYYAKDTEISLVLDYDYEFSFTVNGVPITGNTFNMPDHDVVVGTTEFIDHWGIANGADGTEEHPYVITTTAGLDLLAAKVGGQKTYKDTYFVLEKNIEYDPSIDNNYTCIGNGRQNEYGSSNFFDGNFNGKGHTISGIRINKQTNEYQGLFGEIGSFATVQNVTLCNADIIGKKSCGGIAGDNAGGCIKNCTVANSVHVQSEGLGAGGIVGSNTLGFIINCTSRSTISSSNDNSAYGGIAGYDDGGTLIGNFVINATIPDVKRRGAVASIKGKSTLQHNYYSNSTVGGITNATGVGVCQINNNYIISDIATDDGAVYVDLIIDGESTEPVSVSAGSYSHVIYRRNITAGIPTTIMLPFDFDASAFGTGTFYKFTGVNTETWKAAMTSDNTLTKLSANTPYILKPTESVTMVEFSNVTINNTTAQSVTAGDWTFHGTYKRLQWNTNGEITTTNIYGFAATSTTNNDGDPVAAGEFVCARSNVGIKPTRAYLEYNVKDGNISKSALSLPDRISVVFIDKETASVIDNPVDDPSTTGDDIETPTSELTPAANVKVWSYDKTIYIAAAPGTAYRIIDANGRPLRTATTQSDRDEIHLGGKADGIVIVIIGGKAYKISY